MAGSGASNSGWANVFPNSNVDPHYVNVTNSHDPAMFSSNDTLSNIQYHGVSNDVAAANASAYNNSTIGHSGGSNKKKISSKYRRMHKMKSCRMKSRKMKNHRTRKSKRSLMKRLGGKRRSMKWGGKRKSHKRKHMRGAQPAPYQSFGSDTTRDFYSGYSVGGVHLSPNLSALANPGPITPYNNCSF